MVYMAAQDSAELDEHAVRDLREMERVGSGETVNVVVQINRPWPGRPQRYKVLQGNSELDHAPIDQTKMGRPETLKEFLFWALNHHPADRYFLVLWGHAYGLGFGRDHDDPLTLRELTDALSLFRDKRADKESGSAKPELDLLGANACAMSYAEAAYELKGRVQYLVASQIAVPFAGWPYASILKRINHTTLPEHLGKAVVDSYVNHFTASSAGARVAMTLLNIAAVENLQPRVRDLARCISNAIASNTPFASNRLTHIRTAFLATAAGDVRPLIDLYDLCEELKELCTDLEILEGRTQPEVAALRDEAAQLLTFVQPQEEVTKIFASGDPDSADPSSRLVVFHKRHPDLDGLHGLGIFAPFVTDEQALKRLGLVDSTSDGPKRPATARELYKDLNLVRETVWPKLVFDDLRQELSPEIVDDVEVAGTTTRADRSAITQMLISVDSAFNKFDRTLATTKLRAERGLSTAKPEYRAITRATPADVVARFRLLQLFQPAYADAVLEKAQAAGTAVNPDGRVLSNKGVDHADSPAGAGPSVAPLADEVVEALRTLEKAVGEIERTTKRALTHATFGLGPPLSGKPGLGDPFLKSGLGDPFLKSGLGDPFLKSGLGDPFLKSGLGDPFLKSGLGDPFLKSGLGDPFLKSGLGAVVASLAADALSPTRSVVLLFALVGEALGNLERAVAQVEGTAAMVLAQQLKTPDVEFKLQLEACEERIRSAFRILEAASNTARRTLRRVLADPVYGLGPGLRDVGLEQREELADAGGLSSRNLVLL
jgi:hypothetical protein